MCLDLLDAPSLFLVGLLFVLGLVVECGFFDKEDFSEFRFLNVFGFFESKRESSSRLFDRKFFCAGFRELGLLFRTVSSAC